MTETTSQNEETMLTPLQARIIGALIEKQRTTPDYYPLTLNALVQACNQKTSRNPVMHLTPGETGHAVNELRDRELVRARFSGRTERYEQRLSRVLELDRHEEALLCALMLRGSQTLGELRTNTSRMVEFDDLAQVNDTLELMMVREPPLVTKLPRATGRREERFAQLLCGHEEQEQPPQAEASATDGDSQRVVALEQELKQIRAELEQLWQLTGLEDQRKPQDED